MGELGLSFWLASPHMVTVQCAVTHESKGFGMKYHLLACIWRWYHVRALCECFIAVADGRSFM